MHRQSTGRVILPQHVAFSAAVRELRARRGMSQEELGFVSGLHRNYIGSIERGEINAISRTACRPDWRLVRPS
jgi:transcriptional regulator with XRE-family HTH domain